MSSEFIDSEKIAASMNGGVGPEYEQPDSAEPPIQAKDTNESERTKDLIAENDSKPEQKPEAPEVKSEAPEEKPEAPEEKPEAPEEKRETPEEKPDVPEAKPETSEEKPEAPEEKPKVPEEKPEWLDVLGSGSIMKKTIKEGRPDTRPEKNQKCTINYTCSLEDGTLVDTVTGFELYLGECDVISGLDVALGLMNVEERSILKIQPRLAYGRKGLFPRIPADSTVVFDIELLKVEDEEDIDRLSIQQRKLLGNKKRETGNWWYLRGENNIAIQCYRRALDYLEEVERRGDASADPVTDTELQSLLEDRISVHNNMAAAQIKMEMYQPALDSLQTVLTCQPGNVKAHFRKAKVYIGKNDLHMAMSCLQKAQKLAPDDPEIQKEINNVKRLLEKQKATERELARRMFNGPKKADGDDSEKKEKDGKSKLSLWATLGAAVTLGVASFIAYRLK